MQASPEEAYRKFDELTARHIETLRRLTKAIQVRARLVLVLEYRLHIHGYGS
jgi:hypothetical protein